MAATRAGRAAIFAFDENFSTAAERGAGLGTAPVQLNFAFA
jgi:hypothetical protein